MGGWVGGWVGRWRRRGRRKMEWWTGRRHERGDEGEGRGGEGVKVFFCDQVGKSVPLLTFSKKSFVCKNFQKKKCLFEGKSFRSTTRVKTSADGDFFF